MMGGWRIPRHTHYHTPARHAPTTPKTFVFGSTSSNELIFENRKTKEKSISTYHSPTLLCQGAGLGGRLCFCPLPPTIPTPLALQKTFLLSSLQRDSLCHLCYFLPSLFSFPCASFHYLPSLLYAITPFLPYACIFFFTSCPCLPYHMPLLCVSLKISYLWAIMPALHLPLPLGQFPSRALPLLHHPSISLIYILVSFCTHIMVNKKAKRQARQNKQTGMAWQGIWHLVF